MREELCFFGFSLFVLLVVMKFFEVLKNLFFVPKCISCNERLSPLPENEIVAYGKVCFCSDCLKKWERAKGTLCPVCSNISALCSCHPSFFKDKQPSIPSVCFYNPDSNNVQTRAILKMKRTNNAQYFEFMAEELAPSLEKVFTRMALDPKDCVFTWIPRTDAAIAENGFDQGMELAKKVAQRFGASVQPSFTRRRGKEQKLLSKKDRSKNAETSIFLKNPKHKNPFDRKGKRVKAEDLASNKAFVIVDDVMTTGATLKRGVELLKKSGAKTVIIACIAKTEAKTKK